MRLLSHNLLQSPLSQLPLNIKPDSTLIHSPTPPNTELIANLLQNSKLDLPTLLAAVTSLASPLSAITTSLPPTASVIITSLIADPLQTLPTASLETLHTLLMDVHVQDGGMVDQDSGREFRIENGIPNLILLEDEL